MDELFLYLRLGFKHIIDLGGVDHILFVLALTLEFLNPATRSNELTPYVLMELKK